MLNLGQFIGPALGTFIVLAINTVRLRKQYNKQIEELETELNKYAFTAVRSTKVINVEDAVKITKEALKDSSYEVEKAMQEKSFELFMKI